MQRTLSRWLRRINFRAILMVAVGVALYFVLARFLSPQIPFAGRLRLQYAVLGICAVTLGPLQGLAVGFFGQLLAGAFGAGLWWSEIAASALAGFGVGFLAANTWLDAGGFYGRAVRRYALAVLVAFAAAFLVVCPALDMLLYREAIDNLVLRSAARAGANGLTALAGGGLLLKLYNKLQRRQVVYEEGWEDW